MDAALEHDLADLYVERDIEIQLLRTVQSASGVTVLHGEAGSGKTSLLWHLHRRLRDSATAVLLRADTLTDNDPDETCTAFRQGAEHRGILLIDTADAVLPVPDRRRTLLEVIDGVSSLGWSVLLTSRIAEAARFLPGYTKTEIPPRYSQREFVQIVETHARHFYRQPDLDSRSKQVTDLLQIVSHGAPVADLAVRPLLLRMLFVLYAPESIPADINAFELYDHYWERRVRTDWRAGRPEPEREAIDHKVVALDLAYAMLADGELSIPVARLQHVLTGAFEVNQAIGDLVSRSVLVHVSRDKPNDHVAFFHQTFFEHAAARALLARQGPNGLSALFDRLKSDPDDHLRAPVLSHALLLEERSTAGLRSKARGIVEEILRDGPPYLAPTAVSVFAQATTASPTTIAALHAAMADPHIATAFVRASSSAPRSRQNDIWTCFRKIWDPAVSESGNRPWAARRAVLDQLARLALHPSSAAAVVQFVHEYRVAELVQDDAVEQLSRVLLALAEQEPDASLGLLRALRSRIQREFPKHEGLHVSIALAIARHPNPGQELLDDILKDVNTTVESNVELKTRVEGFVRAAMLRCGGATVDDLVSMIKEERSPVVLSAAASWASDQPVNIWNLLWDLFVRSPDHAYWTQYFWDRLGLLPRDDGDPPAVRASEYLTKQVAAGLLDEADQQRTACLSVCRRTRSFYLRIAILQAHMSRRVQPVTLDDLTNGDRLGPLLGPALVLGVIGGEFAERAEILARDVRTQLLTDTKDILVRAPHVTAAVVAFLIRVGQWPRLVTLLREVDCEAKLEADSLRRLDSALDEMLRSKSPQKRKLAARLIHLAILRGLGCSTAFSLIRTTLETETDARTRSWLTVALANRATSETEVESAIGLLREEIEHGDTWVRDDAFETLLDVVVTARRFDALDYLLRDLEHLDLNLRRLRALFSAVPSIATIEPKRATAALLAILALPALHRVGPAVHRSLRIQSKAAIVRWSLLVPLDDLVEVLRAVPRVPGDVGLLLLDALVRPPHAQRLREVVLRLFENPTTPPEVKQGGPKLLQRGAETVSRWESLTTASLPLGGNGVAVADRSKSINPTDDGMAWPDWQPNDRYLAQLVLSHSFELRRRLDEWGLASFEFRTRLDKWFANFEASDKPLAEKLFWNVDYYSHARFDEVLRMRFDQVRRVIATRGLSINDLVIIVPGHLDSADRHAYDLAKVWQLDHSSIVRLRDLNIASVKGRPIVWFNDTQGTGNQFFRTVWKDLGPLSQGAAVTCIVSVAIAREAIAAFQTELGTAVSLIPSEPAHAAQDVLTKEEMLRVREVGERVYRKWPVGYGNTSLVVAYYFQCPNNSLPILWADGANNKSDGSALQWSPLFPYRPKTKSRVG